MKKLHHYLNLELFSKNTLAEIKKNFYSYFLVLLYILLIFTNVYLKIIFHFLRGSFYDSTILKKLFVDCEFFVLNTIMLQD